MTTNYDRRPIHPSDAWLLDTSGRVVGVELAQACDQKSYLPGMGNDSGTNVTLGTVTANLAGNVTGNVAGNVAGTAASTNTANVGTPGTGVTAVENGDGNHHITTLTVATVLPAIAGGASLGVGVLLYTLPAGAQIVWSSRMSMAITQTTGHINANTPTVGLGTVVASGAISVLSGTATFQSIIVGTAAANCTGTATLMTATPTASPFTLITETGGVKSIYFNAAAAWSASGDPAAVLAGTVVLDWDTLA
jgi:hypothetical protein